MFFKTHLLLLVLCFLPSLAEAKIKLFVVSISDFKSFEFRSLPPSALNIYHLLVEKGVVNKDDVERLIDAEATCENILKKLETFFTDLTPEDTAIIYYASHGIRRKKQWYLITHESDTENPTKTALKPLQLITPALENKNLGRLLVFLDTCYSGRLVDQFKEVKGPRITKVNIICSASSKDVGYARKEFKASYFAYFFEKGLGGEADFNHDHKITVGELAQYIGSNVEETSGSPLPFGFRLPPQTPQYYLEDADYCLAFW